MQPAADNAGIPLYVVTAGNIRNDAIRSSVGLSGRLVTALSVERCPICDKCADIDYRVADVWRPCWVPTRQGTRQRQVPGEDDYEAARIIAELRQANKRLTQRIGQLLAENEALRTKPADSPALVRVKIGA